MWNQWHWLKVRCWIPPMMMTRGSYCTIVRLAREQKLLKLSKKVTIVRVWFITRLVAWLSTQMTNQRHTRTVLCLVCSFWIPDNMMSPMWWASTQQRKKLLTVVLITLWGPWRLCYPSRESTPPSRFQKAFFVVHAGCHKPTWISQRKRMETMSHCQCPWMSELKSTHTLLLLISPEAQIVVNWRLFFRCFFPYPPAFDLLTCTIGLWIWRLTCQEEDHENAVVNVGTEASDEDGGWLIY